MGISAQDQRQATRSDIFEPTGPWSLNTQDLEPQAEDPLPETPLRWIRAVFQGALGYYVLAQLGLSLAIPLGYASPVWLPAGLALGSLLIQGQRSWPGILLGAFLTQITLLSGSASLDPSLAVLASLLIAGGATLQAVLGNRLILRFLGPSPAFETGRDALIFTLGGGLASSLLSPSVAVPVLCSIGQMSWSDGTRNWLSWWVGDSLGVLLFTPPLLAWLSRPSSRWKERRKLITGSAGTLLLFLLAADSTLGRWESDRLKLLFQQRVEVLLSQVEVTLHRDLQALRSVRGLFAASQQVDRGAFQRFTEQHLEDLPDLFSLGWAPRVFRSQREALEQAVQAQGFPQFTIKELNESGQHTQAQERSWYVPMLYVEPRTPDAPWFGLDMAARVEALQAMSLATDRGKPVATGRIPQGTVGSYAEHILVFDPVYLHGQEPETPEQRREALQGFVVAILQLRKITRAADIQAQQDGIHYVLIDATNPNAPGLLHSSFQSAQTGTLDVLTDWSVASLAPGALLTHEHAIPVAGRLWTLSIQADPRFTALYHVQDAEVALLVGLLLTALLTTAVLEFSGRARTLRHQVEGQTAELRIERQRLANILWGTDVGTWEWNIQTGETRFNERWAEIIGYTLEELSPTTLETWQRLCHPEDLSRSAARLHQHFEHGEPYECELRMRHKDSRWVWVLDRGKVVSRTADGTPLWMVGTHTNITSRKAAEETLRASEEKLRGLYELAPLGIALTDQSGRFIEFNNAFATITGYSRVELATCTYWDITPSSYREDEHRQQQSLQTTGRYGPYEKEYRTKDGRHVPVALNGMRIIGEDGKPYIWSIIEDISQRKTRERELTALTTRLQTSNAELEQFAYVTSHDLRQPLRMVNSFVQLLERRLDKSLDEDARKMMRFAVEGAQRMDQMLLSLLEYSRVGRRGEPMIRLSIRAALDEALRFLAPVVRESGATIEILGDWPSLMASRDELTRLFQNLVGNALKYRDPARPPRIEIEASQDDGCWQFLVRDNGIGIDPKQFERLFRVFQRLHTSSQYEGTGVGLAIVRKIVTRHGGRVWVESLGEGTGTTIHFTLSSEQGGAHEAPLG